MKEKIEIKSNDLLQSIISLIDNARTRVAAAVNSELTLLYWNIGKQINVDILNNQRADYGKSIVAELSKQLTDLYGTGFSKRNLHNCLKFNELYPDIQIVHSLRAQLTWTHIRELIYINDVLKRDFYTQLCIHERWSVRTLQNRIDSMLFERTSISKQPEETIKSDIKLLKDESKMSVDLTFRDPYFLEFLGLQNTYSEKDLESSILVNLQQFITEIGTDFAFLSRQKRIVIDNEDFYIDLLFYHRNLQCLVAIELKLGKFKAMYKGQMELYLRWLEKNEMRQGENTPIGLILCSEKSPEQIEYLQLDNAGHIKVAEYLTSLPSKELLQQKLNKAIELAKTQNIDKK